MRAAANSQKQSRTSRRFYRFTKTSVYRIILIAPTARFPNKCKNGNNEPNAERRKQTSVHCHRAAHCHPDHWNADRVCVSRVSGSARPRQESAGKKRSHSDRHGGERLLHGIREVSG